MYFWAYLQWNIFCQYEEPPPPLIHRFLIEHPCFEGKPTKYLDDHYKITNGNILKRTDTLTPMVKSCGHSTTIKKLGLGSELLPCPMCYWFLITGYKGFYTEPGDIFSMWVYVDESAIGEWQHLGLESADANWDFYAQITQPPIPPPTFSPEWKKKIGDL